MVISIKRVVTKEEMKLSDKAAIEIMKMPDLVLMERAAYACYETILEKNLPVERVLAVCGSGNNGGDGIAIARMLHLAGISVEILDTGNPRHRTDSNKRQHDIAENYGVRWTKTEDFSSYSLIIDAVFGVGLSRNLSDEYNHLFRKINQSAACIFAVDIPSGVDGNTGQLMGEAISADVTVTMAFEKPGLLLYPGAFYAGELLTADIGIYEHPSLAYLPSIFHLDERDEEMLPNRREDGNKGSFGKVLLVAGSYGMCGAAYMAASACIRSGAGMVKICTHESNRGILQQQLPEALISCYNNVLNFDTIKKDLAWADVVGIGPGLGQSEMAKELLDFILKESDLPLLIDADGLNLLAKEKEKLLTYQGPVVITPHMGEMSRLTGQSISEIAKDRFAVAGNFAEKYHCLCVLKDARTLLAEDKEHFFISSTGNSGMATAGSGDVLSGMILAFLGQTKDVRKAAILGVHFHGIAGDLAAEVYGKISMKAGDIIESIPQVLENAYGNKGKNNF